MTNKILTTLLSILITSIHVLAQTTISGTISDAADNSLIIGSSVTVKGTINGTISDANGKFTLKINQKLPVTLRITSLGYLPQEVEVKDSNPLTISLKEDIGTLTEVTVSGNRVEESITKSAVSIEQLGANQLQQTAAFDVYSALQNLKGVDLLSQSLTFRSVNLRGFGANNNNRFVQLTDGMDNRSPGLGFGFGSVAGVSDIDIESIEILPGASSALYGPDALQGLMLTKTKSPFEFQGLSAQAKVGVNNVGKANMGAKPYTDFSVRYAKAFNNKVAFKVNFQAINGTDFIADDYSDRMTRARAGFFVTNANTNTVSIGYTPNNNRSTNLQFDGLNIYGDDINNGGAFTFPANFANPALAGKLVSRTGYNEVDLTGDNGKIFSYRANAALHFKLSDKIEAIAGWYFGTGNFIRTAGFREYFPNYKRNQFKLELRGDEFFVRGYNTSQEAVGFSLGNVAARMLQLWKPTATWAADFAKAYTGDAEAARAVADAGKPLPGSAAFQTAFDKLTTTNSNVATGLGVNGVRLLDNSGMYHAEGMYNFKKLLPAMFEVITGASFRRYNLLTEGTVFPRDKNGKEFTINEYGWYLQATPNLKINDKATFKPTVAVRYDKNQYFKGGFTPRVSGVFTLGEHNFRASWQSAFRNPSPNQLLSDGVATSEVGGSRTAVESANLLSNSGYYEASVLKYRQTGNTADLVKYDANPDAFTTEKIKTWEVGYKALIKNKFFVDAFYYQSVYNDFIAAQNIVQPASGQVDALRNAATSKTYQVNFNNFNEIFVRGYGLGLEYVLGKGYNLGFNYAKQIGEITLKDNLGNVRKDAFGNEIVKRKMSNPEVSAVGRNFFISPEDRFNITFSNPKITKNLGFNAAFRWTGKMWVEQGTTAGDIWLPSWNTVDLAFMYKLPKMKSVVKVGGSNIFNKYYAQGYGLANIGGLYYISLNFDEMLR
jgi:iron complex outermembrane recepter protein